MSEKPEDCVPGKSYWTEQGITSHGACAPCPKAKKTCINDQPIEDQQRCVDSCFPKQKLKKQSSTPVLPSFSTSTSHERTSRPSRLYLTQIRNLPSIASPANPFPFPTELSTPTRPVRYKSAVHIGVNVLQTSRDGMNVQHKQLIVAGGALLGLALCVVLAAMLYFKIRGNSSRKPDGAGRMERGNEEERYPLRNIQARSCSAEQLSRNDISETRVGGIQPENEDRADDTAVGAESSELNFRTSLQTMQSLAPETVS